MEEIWKPVPIEGLDTRYEVSNLGNIRSTERIITTKNRWGVAHIRHASSAISTHRDKAGYMVVVLRSDTKKHNLFVHRLVAMAFLPNPNNYPCVDHLDTDRANNNIENLKWCSHKENSLNPITRKHLSASMMGNQRTKGKVFTIEHRMKIAEANKGKKHKESTKEKIRNSLTGRKAKEETRLKRCKPINQYTLDGEFIRQWPSGTDAARELGLGWSNILRCANPKTKNKTAGGFIWKYADKSVTI